MRLLVLCLLLCSMPILAHAQGAAAVYDAANHFQNTLSALRELWQYENQIQDLASLTDMASFLDLVQQATEIINSIQQFAGPLVGRYGRWAEYVRQASTLCNPYKLGAWKRAYSNESGQAYGAAVKAVPLFVDSGQALRMLVQAIQNILALRGTVAGLQTLSGLVGAVLTRTVAMEASNATFQETVQRKDMKELLEDAAVTAMMDAQRNALRGRKTCL
jgi:conjugal transfer/entry exclusion protein